MPRKPIKIDQKIEYLSILDEDGQVDEKLEPDLSDEELKELHRYMLLARRADERFLKMQRQGRIGTFPQSSGHEAISMGSVFAIGSDDWHVPAYRELAGMLYRGWPLEKIILYWNGFEEGACPPEGVKDLPYQVPIASHLPHAVGIGMASKIKEDKNVAITYFGDGASSEGDCHEAMNFASVFKAPVVFVCLNNQYAISVPLERQMAIDTVAQRAISYGMPGIRVDGNDVLAVYQATSEAVIRARAGKGPTLIEGLTYRITPHTTADDPKKYRGEDEEKEWSKREPISRFTKYLIAKGVYTEESLKELEEEIDAEIKSAVERSEALAASDELMDPSKMFDYLYEDIPPFLQEQQEELTNYLNKDSDSELSQKDQGHAVQRGS